MAAFQGQRFFAPSVPSVWCLLPWTWTLELLGTECHEFHCVNIMRICLTCHAWPVGWQGCFSSDIITHTLLFVFARWPLTLCRVLLPFARFSFTPTGSLATLLNRLAWRGCQFGHQQLNHATGCTGLHGTSSTQQVMSDLTQTNNH